METFFALLAICAGNLPVPGEFPTQRPVTRSFGVFFDLRLFKRLSKQSWGWWFETLSHPLWRHRNASRCSGAPRTSWTRISEKLKPSLKWKSFIAHLTYDFRKSEYLLDRHRTSNIFNTKCVFFCIKVNFWLHFSVEDSHSLTQISRWTGACTAAFCKLNMCYLQKEKVEYDQIPYAFLVEYGFQLFSWCWTHPPSAADLCQWIRSPLVLVLACRLFGTKPWLNQCWLTVNWTPLSKNSIISMTFAKLADIYVQEEMR